jgi:hypothetical protein
MVRDIENYFTKVVERYGVSNHHDTTPYLSIEDSPYADADDPDLIGEYRADLNEIIIYHKNIKTIEELIRTLVHEYQHYLQSPSWMTRYYKMGYSYSDHPYEVAAYAEEENWKLVGSPKNSSYIYVK